MTVRAKFRCDGIDLRTQNQPKTDEAGAALKDEAGAFVYESAVLPTVRLSAVTGHEPGASDEDAAENRSFWSATPMGKCELTISNAHAAEFFELGKTYFLDFSAAD